MVPVHHPPHQAGRGRYTGIYRSLKADWLQLVSQCRELLRYGMPNYGFPTSSKRNSERSSSVREAYFAQRAWQEAQMDCKFHG